MHCLHCEVQPACLAQLLGSRLVCQELSKPVHTLGQDMLSAHDGFCQHLQLPEAA